MQLNRSVWTKVRVTAAVCGIGLMGGCASLGNSYLDHKNLFPDAETSTCAEVRPAGAESGDALQRYNLAVACAREVQSSYRKALGERSNFRRRLGTGMIGLGAATLGLGLAGASTDSTLVTGLIGASGAASYQWLNAPPEERAWIAGYDAIECTISAMNPLVMPTVGYSVERIDKNISKIETSIDQVGAASRDLRVWVHRCRDGGCDNGQQAGQFEQLTESAETQLARVANKLDAGRKARRAAVRIAGDIQRAPATLESAVRRIIGQVDLAVQQQVLNMDALNNIVSNVSARYSSLARIPGVEAAPAAEDSTSSKTFVRSSGDDEESTKALMERLKELNSSNPLISRFYTPTLVQPLRDLQERSSVLKQKMDNLKMDDALQSLQVIDEDSDMDAADLQQFSSSLSELNDIARQLSETSPELIGLLSDAIERDRQMIEAQSRRIGEILTIEKRLQERRALESSDSYRFQQDLANLNLAFQNLDEAISSLDDITEIIIERQPLEQLKSCGVDPYSIVGPLRAEPASLGVPSGVRASRSILVRGGVKPYIAQSLSQEQGVMVESRELGGEVFTISISDATPPGRYEILIGDGAGRRLLVPVQAGGDEESATSEQRPQASNSNSAPAKVSAEGADASLNQRIKEGEELITERTIGEIKKAQRALCMSEDQADGIWGPVTQKDFESRFGNGTTLTPEALSQLIGTKNPNSECEQQEDKPPSD